MRGDTVVCGYIYGQPCNTFHTMGKRPEEKKSNCSAHFTLIAHSLQVTWIHFFNTSFPSLHRIPLVIIAHL